MKWDSPLVTAVLKNRYKRFLADVEIDGELHVVHVPNTGSMTSCWEPGWTCAVSRSPNPARKLPLTLELTHNGETWIGVNTGSANRLVKGWLRDELIPELQGYRNIIPERKIGSSRVDFFLEGHATLPDCFVEVKNVTLKKDGIAQFPDAVSERGQKHLRELSGLKKNGFRAAMLFVIPREDVSEFAPAAAIDPEYARLLTEAHEAGVEILVYRCKMDIEAILLGDQLPYRLGP